MHKLLIATIAFLILIGAVFVEVAAAKNEKGRVLLSFQTMYGVDGPFVGEGNPIREVIGDDLPWEIAQSIKGKLDTAGHLKITVRGLVFKDDPSVPAELIDKNDEAEFRGLVSCLSEEGESVVTKNVITPGFPATVEGDAVIDTQIELPDPCVAPIVMVLAGSEEKWFAVTGFEAEEE